LVGGFAPSVQSGVDFGSWLAAWEGRNGEPVSTYSRKIALATFDRAANQSEWQAKIDLQHPNRDRKNQVRFGVKNDIRERRKTGTVILSVGNDLAQPNQRVADIGVDERILAPDKFDDVPVSRNLKAFVRYVNKKSQLFNRGSRSTVWFQPDFIGGRCRFRTCDPRLVRPMLYHWANRPRSKC
jgi:hypothetical protein